jgi:hypothetical protein
VPAARPAAAGPWAPWDNAEQILLAVELARRSHLLGQEAAARSRAAELEFAAFLRDRRNQDEQHQDETERLAQGTLQNLVRTSQEALQHLAAEEARSREEFHARGEAFRADLKARKQRLKQQGAENERMFAMAVLGLAAGAPAGGAGAAVAKNGGVKAAVGKASQTTALASKATPAAGVTRVPRSVKVIDVKSWTDKMRARPVPSGKDVPVIDVKAWTDKMRSRTFDKWSQYEDYTRTPGYWRRLAQREFVKDFQDSYVASSIVSLLFPEPAAPWTGIVSLSWSWLTSLPDALSKPAFPPRK